MSTPPGVGMSSPNSGAVGTMTPHNTPGQPSGGHAVVKKKVASEAIITASNSRRLKEARFSCTVPGCNATFTANHNLKNHLNSHNNVKNFKCDSCGALFTTAGVLARHVKNTHGTPSGHF
jgi:uncharacterized Zn-finger protein